MQNIISTSARFNKRKRVTSILLGALFFSLLSYWSSYRFYLNVETEKADAASAFSASTLRHIMWQHQPLLYAISIDSRAFDSSQKRDIDKTNSWLAALAHEADLEAIYLIDPSGLTLASSNYAEPSSFIGENYSFRPYFTDAIQGNLGTFFAIGVTTGLPGYFLSLPVRDEAGQVRAVIAAKLSVRKFEPLWQVELSDGFVSNEDGVIILSSNPNWLYRSTTDLAEAQLSLIQQKRQFANQEIRPLDWKVNDRFANLEGQHLIHSIQPITETNWQVHHFRSTAIAQQKASLVAVIVTTILLAFLTAGLAIRSKRIRSELKESELNRQELEAINQRLQQEIRERKQAEQDLARAQKRLIQSSRMAALGQLSASVIHELGQPLSTFQNYLAAAEISPAGAADPKLFVQLSKVAQRMQSTTDELRSFARPDAQTIETVDLNEVVESAIRLTVDKLEQGGVEVERRLSPSPALLEGRQQRLEQVIINLITNACQALVESPSPKIKIELHSLPQARLLTVTDNGLGFGGQSPEQLFEAFYTTGTRGNNLGLGLAICTAIVSEHHGEIWAKENPDGGAIFYIKLPLTYHETC